MYLIEWFWPSVHGRDSKLRGIHPEPHQPSPKITSPNDGPRRRGLGWACGQAEALQVRNLLREREIAGGRAEQGNGAPG